MPGGLIGPARSGMGCEMIDGAYYSREVHGRFELHDIGDLAVQSLLGHPKRGMTSPASISSVSISFLNALQMKVWTPASRYRPTRSITADTVPAKPLYGSGTANLARLVANYLTEAATLQRADWLRLDDTETKTLQDHGMAFNTPDIGPLRALARKNGFYTDMKKRMGDEAWALLERYTGKLA